MIGGGTFRAAAQALRDRCPRAIFRTSASASWAHSMATGTRYCLETRRAGRVRIELVPCSLLRISRAPAAVQNSWGCARKSFLSAAQCREALKNPNFRPPINSYPYLASRLCWRKSAQTGFASWSVRPRRCGAVWPMSGSLRAAQELATELPFIGPISDRPALMSLSSATSKVQSSPITESGRAPQRRRGCIPATALCRC